MHRRSGWAAILAVLLAALLTALAGCQGDDEPAGDGGGGGAAAKDAEGKPEGEAEKPGQGGGEPGNPGPSTAVRIVVDRVLVSGEPLLACDLYVTPRYLRTAYGGRDGCLRAQGEKAVADSVTIRKVRVQGAKASAVAVPSGGASDGETLEVSLVHQVGAWKVDRIESDVPVGP